MMIDDPSIDNHQAADFVGSVNMTIVDGPVAPVADAAGHP
jgi:hypothetical protein